MEKELLEQIASYLKSIHDNSSIREDFLTLAEKLDVLIELHEKHVELSEDILSKLKEIYSEDESFGEKLLSIDYSMNKITDQLSDFEFHLKQIQSNTDRIE